jgi:signal transduction histidine kinase
MGNINLKREKISLHDLGEESVELLSELIMQKNNTAVIKIPEDLYCYADAQTLKAVIRNLLTNANKFTENGTITIKSEIDKNVVRTIIQDSGVGITENRLKNLFEVEKSKTTEGTKGEMGTGLGLIICKDFISKNGGKIHAESELNKGTSIIFTLPLYEPQS